MSPRLNGPELVPCARAGGSEGSVPGRCCSDVVHGRRVAPQTARVSVWKVQLADNRRPSNPAPAPTVHGKQDSLASTGSGPSCALSWAVDGCILCCNTTSSCQSAAISKVVKHCCHKSSHVSTVASTQTFAFFYLLNCPSVYTVDIFNRPN